MIELSFSTIWLPIILTLPMLLIFTAKDVLGVINNTNSIICLDIVRNFQVKDKQ